ncbi:hypothetical protein V4V35_23860 [Bacillus infantis]|uniref:hypothetical protein n=1 Tax=Bacillus infantis TaxID=324767 RepID=UPI002FBE2A69
MNTSQRNINKEIQDILLKAKNAEPAFDGTVLEGRDRKYTIIKEADLERYVPDHLKAKLRDVVSNVGEWIEAGRMAEGKAPYNNYIVNNVDEPYIEEIIKVMKQYGRWDENSKE